MGVSSLLHHRARRSAVRRKHQTRSRDQRYGLRALRGDEVSLPADAEARVAALSADDASEPRVRTERFRRRPRPEALGRRAPEARPAEPLDVPGAHVERVDGPRQWLRFRRDAISAADLTAAVAEQARLVDLAVEEPDIEDIVRRIYTEGVTPPEGRLTEAPSARPGS
jgi:hypothetical protein